MKFRYLIASVAFMMSSFCAVAQYEFKHDKELDCTAIKNQNRTGTCWSFATSSFIESELMRMGHGQVDLSEMYVVRSIYKDKAMNYVLRQGKANFSQGSLAHDLLNITAKNGVVPQAVYSGMINDETAHDHSELENVLKGFLDGLIKSKKLSAKWPVAFNAVLDAYLGPIENKFQYEGKKYTPQTFRESMGIIPEDYIHLTSFSHHDFNSSFILEIPDNYSNGSFYNVPLDEMVKHVDHAIKKGFTIAWDGDVSEKGFSSKEGIAVLPIDVKREDLFQKPGAEMEVDQVIRQQMFQSYETTDDHLMHIVGTAKDQEGNKYYIIKNSWGEIGPFKGYLYMSEAYLRMKTVSVTMHKDGMKK